MSRRACYKRTSQYINLDLGNGIDHDTGKLLLNILCMHACIKVQTFGVIRSSRRMDNFHCDNFLGYSSVQTDG